jgi:hypothetical protein
MQRVPDPDSGVVRLVRPADGAVFELRAHVQDKRATDSLHNVTPDPLDYYHHARMLHPDGEMSGRLHGAGCRLRQHFQSAAIDRLSRMRYLDVRFGSPEGSDRQEVSRALFTRALTACSRVSVVYLWDVVCFGRWAKDVAHSLGHPQRYGIVRFREALDELRDWYDAPNKNPPSLPGAGIVTDADRAMLSRAASARRAKS